MGPSSEFPFASSSFVSKKLLILGAGFGLYGYLPAAIKNGYSVHTLNRYQSLISSRSELSEFVSGVDFVDEEIINFNLFDGIVIARTPVSQLDFVGSNMDFKGHFFLEKPLGANSDAHSHLVNLLSLRKIEFSVAYLFRHLDWYQELMNVQGRNCSVNIDWRIPEINGDTWKGDSRFGGGLASYYGIHLFSLLVDLGASPDSMEYDYSVSSLIVSGEVESTSIRFSVSYSQSPSFQVEVSKRSDVKNWSLLSPFGLLPSGGLNDPRVPALSEYLRRWGSDENLGDRAIHERKVIEFRRIVEELM